MAKHGVSQDIVVVGRSCRLPGAANVDELWANLIEGRCSVSRIPDDRWALDKHGHPRPKEPGKSYTWAAGVLEDPWGFDPTALGISPREAEQMDPQQRLMLELTWEALDDAGMPRATVAGSEIGVYVGASGFDFSVVRAADMATSDAYTATGGALSIVSNRVSYAFDLRGPSFTVDTACSSSLVALDQAVSALRSGRIDTAIVGGISVLMSPFGFIIFSQASMLSPTGLCRTFDAGADGYVRAEGGVVLVLKTAERAARDGSLPYASIVASGTNSDGRTNGIALPSRFSQSDLLRRLYGEGRIDVNDLAFAEAHGTGTKVGDPIEAFTIGETLGRGREAPLPIGSIKSNIGHLEPASGLAGVLKAMLALEHDRLPPTVNFTTPNPDIPFDDLNLRVASEAVALPPRGDRPRLAGINSFGFGGTNAHVVIADPPARKPIIRRGGGQGGDRFGLSAATRPALRALVARHAELLRTASSDRIRETAAAVAHRRELLAERVVFDWTSPRELIRKLETAATRDDDLAGVVWGNAVEANAPVAFVFSGNGSQWPGMGQAAYAKNAAYREAFDEVDALFDQLFGWSVAESLFAPDLADRIHLTSVAQPLIFAIQVAVARALAREGLAPSFTLGHSVGEVAAAHIAGALSLRDAVRVIQARSTHQELAKGHGLMGVVAGPRPKVEALIEEVGGLEIAAYNSPRTMTVAGPTDRIEALAGLSRRRRLAFRQLDLDYPFHSRLIDGVEAPLLADLADLESVAPTIPFVSTVTGDEAGEVPLDATYWWRNVREPVRFEAALERAGALGARVFVEIGPRSLLQGNIGEVMEAASLPHAALGVLEREEAESERDPIRAAVTGAFVRGAAIDRDRVFGPAPAGKIPLPSYPWQRRDFRINTTDEAVGFQLSTRWHRLLGDRSTAGGTEWSGRLDTALLPELADHVVGGQPILPAAAFIEMGLAVARDWFGAETATLLDLDIQQAMPLERDRARDVKARLSPNGNVVEIMSRPRLSGADWQLHATAKISRGSGTPFHTEPAPTGGAVVPAAEVYRAAESIGLDYGPAFRLVEKVRRPAEDVIAVDLVPSAPHGDYRLDPARLDACFHGLFVLLDGLGAASRGMAYLPMRFGHVRLASPGALPATAAIRIRRANDRSMLADFTLYDAQGEAIAVLTGSRFQAVRLARQTAFAEAALTIAAVPVDRGALGAVGTERGLDALKAAAARPGSADAAAAEDEAPLLLEGWAEAASYELLRSLSGGETLTHERLAALPASVAAWLTHQLLGLESVELAARGEDGWTVAAGSELPPAAIVLRTLAAENPNRSAELMLASGLMAAVATGPAWLDEPVLSGADDAVAAFELGGVSARSAADRAARLLAESGLLTAGTGAPRLLQVGFGPLTHVLKRRVAEAGGRLTILEPNARRFELARLELGPAHDIAVAASVADLQAGSFDLCVAAESLGHPGLRLDEIATLLAPGAALLAVEPRPSLFRDLALGLQPDWFAGGTPDFPAGPVRGADEWRAALVAADLAGEVETEEDPGAPIVILAEKPAILGLPIAEPVAPAVVETIGGKPDPLTRAIARALGTEARETVDAIDPGATLVMVAPAARKADGDRAAVAQICLALKDRADALAGSKAEIWLVTPASGAAPLADPVVAAVSAFGRTFANEYPNVRLRRVAVAAEAPDAAATLAALVAGGTSETDIRIDAGGTHVLRVGQPSDSGSRPAEVARLERGASGGLAHLAWRGGTRGALKPGEVRIAVAATGLNFRDVMWAMSLLPDEVLEDGFAGPDLGLECAGVIEAVGADVAGFGPGDRVVAFAPRAFTTSVDVPAAVVARIPAGMDTEAAATVPVAFLTAYYGLVTLAGLKAGETVLVHGGAGGVGLAAIQIAQWRGAHVVATAGSAAKRELLRTLGVEHVLNSRSSDFADDLRDIVPEGVDIVLNSLFGEAMERGLSTLKPFGRFVELGKRDYVANTHVGLRPFRRNLSYFGVDVDQLLSDRDRASEVFGEVVALLAEGRFTPLPYRVFPADEVVDAFRLMQRSGHVGKILIRPPTFPVAAPLGTGSIIDGERTHLVTGGFGGFGLETARWLADHGARHLVLVGRSGAASPEAIEAVAALRERGVTVRAEACDIADEAAVARLLKTVRATMPPLAGIMHAAMVLEDGVIANLTADALDRVLAPKIEGARHLDALTRADTLDYFVLFSSVTTVMGNPGQGAYVAANGYLEGLARRRRAEGLPALAVAWGAIADVGVLARDKGLADLLAKRVGVKAMPARIALDLMVEAMRRRDASVDGAVVALGGLDWSAARRLPALGSPTFATLLREGGSGESSERGAIDLRALAASGDPDAVRRQVVTVIIEEIAAVLRVPKSDVPTTKRLAEIGLDSLMAIELATGLQDRLTLSNPPGGSVAALSVLGLADHLISTVQSGGVDEETQVTQTLGERHAGDEVDAATLAAVTEAVSERSRQRGGLLQ